MRLSRGALPLPQDVSRFKPDLIQNWILRDRISIKMPLFVPQMGRREARRFFVYDLLARNVSRYSDGSENSKAVSYANSYKSRRYESRSILDSK